MLVVKRMSWPNLSDLLTGDENASVGLVGAPLAAGSVTPGNCDLAPGRLRAVLKRMGRYNVETGHELSAKIRDHGDVDLFEDAIAYVAEVASRPAPSRSRRRHQAAGA